MEQNYNLKKGDIFIIDPCYILEGLEKLKLMQTHKVDDGDNYLFINEKYTAKMIGVDSGEIGVYQANEDAIIKTNAGLSGAMVIDKKKLDIKHEKISFKQLYYDEYC